MEIYTLYAIFRPYGIQRLISVHTIFHPYGWKFTAKFRYFPSVRTLIQQMAPYYCP